MSISEHRFYISTLHSKLRHKGPAHKSADAVVQSIPGGASKDDLKDRHFQTG